MTDCFLGEIRIFGGNYAPEDWHLCNGALLSIQTYPALYSLLGTAYGGDAVTTFGLPNFNGRIVVGQGQMSPPPAGSTSSNYLLGQMGGAETVSLTAAQNAAHNHTFYAVNTPATGSSPVNTMLASPVPNGTTTGLYMDVSKAATAQVADANFLDFAGGAASGGSSHAVGDPHQNMMPFLTLTYIICVNGLYPDRP